MALWFISFSTSGAVAWPVCLTGAQGKKVALRRGLPGTDSPLSITKL
jgi:hypothetical protein